MKGKQLDKEIYPVGSKVRVTKNHSLSWEQPWPETGDVLTVKERHAMPHSWGPKVDVYVTTNKAGRRVVVCEDKIEPAGTFSKGDKVFVTETHSVEAGRYVKVYAGTHLTIAEFSAGFADVPAHYWGVNEAGENRTLLADKIALVESEPDKLTPPVAPSYVGKQGETVWVNKGMDEGGYWTYDNYWGWSNFVPVKADLYRKPVKGEDMGTNGVLATSALDGSVQVV